MTATDDSSIPNPSPPPPPRRLRRSLTICCITAAILLLVLVAVAITLAFTVFRRRHPQTTLIYTHVFGVSPSLSLPSLKVQLNVSLGLLLLVRNPNYASFRHDAGESLLSYHGQPVGRADVAPGVIPARGSGKVAVQVKIGEDQGYATDLGPLVMDALAGELGVDASTTIPGRVTLLGVIKRDMVATSECHLVIGFPEMELRRRECTEKLTQL